MVESMKAVPLTPGKDYECVVVSFDPLEGPGLAARKKESFLQAYERPAAGAGIHFLTGEKPNIARLAATIGFGYKWVEQDRMYAHPASLYVCTPAGRISQYLKGVAYDPAALRLSLVEASHGKIGTVSDQLAMFCFQYDPSKGKYSLSAIKLMRIAGVLTVLAIVIGLLVLRNLRRRKLVGEPAR
jgi:protein SCO1/2